MEMIYILISVFSGLITGVVLSFIFFSLKKEKIIIEKERSNFEEEKSLYSKFEDEKKLILTEKLKEIDLSYHKGFEEGYKRAEMNSKVISLQISEWEGTSIKKEFLRSTTIKKIGYQYQLLVNGIPCLQPHVIVEKELNMREANESNVKYVIELVKESVDKAINNIGGLASFVGDFDKLKDSIIKQIPKRK